MEREEAARIARTVEGAQKVENRIELRAGGSGSSSRPPQEGE